MPLRSDTSPIRARRGARPTDSVPASNDSGNHGSSELIEAPLRPRRDPLDAHDFATGGGSGGAEAFRRVKKKR